MSNLENNNEFNTLSLYWRHNGCDSVSKHQPDGRLLDYLLRRRSKKTSKLRVTGLCVGNSPGTGEFPAQMASNAENVFIWWRHHVIGIRIGKFDFIHPRGVDILPSLTLETIKESYFLWFYISNVSTRTLLHYGIHLLIIQVIILSLSIISHDIYLKISLKWIEQSLADHCGC